jgi:hypothetical protein
MKKQTRAGKKIGSKGCPACGSHNTESINYGGAQWCNACGYRWAPCDTPHCRGYEIDLGGDVPVIRGCKGCGVPDRIARWWPEAYRAIHKVLLDRKLKEMED